MVQLLFAAQQFQSQINVCQHSSQCPFVVVKAWTINVCDCFADKIERAYWRKCIAPNGGRSDNAAKSDDIGISVLTQGVTHFSWKSSSTVEAKDSQASFFWDSRTRSLLLCSIFQSGFESDLIWYCLNLEENIYEILLITLTNGSTSWYQIPHYWTIVRWEHLKRIIFAFYFPMFPFLQFFNFYFNAKNGFLSLRID